MRDALRLAAVLTMLPISLVGSTASGSPPPQQEGPKIYISADFEGVTGVVTGEQLGPDGFEYGRFREFMTGEVLAAIEGARAAGAGEILVSDSHGNGQNLLIDRFGEDVKIVRSWPRALTMMEGIDDSFDGAIFIGYHAGTTNPEGVRAHTMSSATLTDIRINDYSSNETIWNAAVAGNFGVPVIMVSGDDATAAEAKARLGDIETAVVKWAHSFHSATTLTPKAGQAAIRQTAERAVRRLLAGEIDPYLVQTPVAITVRFKHYQPSQILAYLQMFERIDAHAVRYNAADMEEAARTLVFLRNYRADITP
ncbi:MAG: M55 family metallopeptidase [Acidobacteriota bacterium]|nr:M55 family metallopeptidase [Acidobacteriota bacterium]MEE3151724.1 M55 family metallopeptidase [Acidobacteriota bacterium]|tara:strand:- start:3323 stop:4252 length:930 start_codon:yes stop_codon:yes gene_type:complete